MSIHDKVAVPEGESHETNYTRDRFGRRHRLANEDGTPRIQYMRHLAVASFFLISVFFNGHVQASPNTTVSSDEVQSFWGRGIEREQDDDFNFLKQGDTALGFNDNGDPSLSTRF